MADKTDVQELVRLSDSLFSQRHGLHDLWQAIAENFYVERADFTTDRTTGAAFADHLFGSYPVFARRELGNLIASMLRPRQFKWFGLHVTNEDMDEEKENRDWLEWATGVQWRAMYDPEAMFVSATKMADHDFAAFGNAAIEVGINRRKMALLHRPHHLRDVAWSDDASGTTDTVYRRWKPTARQLYGEYGAKCSAEVKNLATGQGKEPETVVECCQAVIPARSGYTAATNGRQFPWTVIYFEKNTLNVLEEKPEKWFRYVIPRWHKVTGSQYARSPATEIVLPDARTFQVVIRTLREAGEMHVNPPLVGVMDALRSDVQQIPGGFTAIDIEYDERLGEAIRPLEQNPGSMPIGFEIAAALRDDIRLGFFLDKIKLPEVDTKAMTAYEVQKRLEEHIRSASPLFEPIEDEYSIPLCNLDFEILKANGAFGRPEDIPEGLQGANVEFKLRSPLREIEDQAKAGLFADGLQRVIMPAIQLKPEQLANINMTEAVRDALRGLGWPSDWLEDEDMVRMAAEAIAKQQQAQAGVDLLQRGGEAAKSIGEGGANIAGLLTDGRQAA